MKLMIDISEKQYKKINFIARRAQHWRGELTPEQIIATGEPCENYIDRQAVLDTLDNMDKTLDEDRTVENYKELLKECYKVLTPVSSSENKTERR